MSGHTLKAAQTVSTSQIQMHRLCKASSTQISAKTICKAADFPLYFIYIQQNHPLIIVIDFFIKEPHGTPQYCGSRRKKIDRIRRVSERK